MAAQHSRYGDYSTRYRFNGKKQDEATGFYYYGARYYEPSLSRWLSVDPLAEKYQGFSPYNYTLNNPIMLVDPDGRTVKDWIKNNLTLSYEWRNEVTSDCNTPENYTYIGKTDASIVTDLFGKTNFKDSDWDVGSISFNDFNNKYSTTGAAANNMYTKTTMSVSLRANVTTELNFDGLSKKFNGIDVRVSITGDYVAPYPDVDIKLNVDKITLGGEKMKTHKKPPSGEFLPGGDVSTLAFDGFLSSKYINSVRLPVVTNIDVNFEGQYTNNGSAMKGYGFFGLSGLANTTNLNISLPLRNTAEPPK